MRKLKSTYKNLFKLLVKDSFYIKASLYLFTLSILLGIIFPQFLSEIRTEIFNAIIDQVKDSNYLQLSFFIIQNNLKTTFISLLLGIIFFPLFALFINGFFIGSILVESVNKTSIWILWRLFPHGVFELPAIILSFAYGLKISLCWFKRNRFTNFKQTYREAFHVFVYIIAPLIIIAGFIEALLF
jgi:stage II sporulation protein M